MGQMQRRRFGTRPAETPFVVRIESSRGVKLGPARWFEVCERNAHAVDSCEQLRVARKTSKEIQAKGGQAFNGALMRKQSSCHT